ncbi:MAG TPA: hypothetical protein VFX18_01980 [Candidatus Nitrosocosmicus sp.]|nr:hypothetical protein [Candidatus Nitrosocosmicus sp.]
MMLEAKKLLDDLEAYTDAYAELVDGFDKVGFVPLRTLSTVQTEINKKTFELLKLVFEWGYIKQ